jgi:hypothetical protein
MVTDDLNGDLITLEHAPPEALGGKEIALTCKPCNSTHGRDFDSHAVNQAALIKHLSGKSRQSEKLEMTADGLRLRAESYIGPNSFGFAAATHPSANRESDRTQFGEILRAAGGESGSSLNVHFKFKRKCIEWRAAVSWVRTAYLIAFAKFGWRWVLNPVLDPIREQLGNSTTETLPPITFYELDAAENRQILLKVEEPGELRGLLAVAWGRRIVFLPGMHDRRTPQEISDALLPSCPIARSRIAHRAVVRHDTWKHSAAAATAHSSSTTLPAGRPRWTGVRAALA